MMTLEEAVATYEQYALDAKQEKLSETYRYYTQLAEWLRELQERRKADRWIPTSERLPDKEFEAGLLNGTVFNLFPCLVTRYATHSPVAPKRLYVAKHYYDGNDFVNNAGQECTEAVIAWMPLPEPYQSEAERRTDD